MRRIPIAYLASFLLSLLGNSIAAIALPLIVLQTTGSVLGAGTVAAATAIPAVLAGLFMGVVIDRVNRRTSSIVTDLVSALAIAALPVVDAVTGLSLGWFIALGILGALGDVPGMTAREALLPAVVRHGGMTLERLAGLREALGAIALILGPALAGVLMTVFPGSTVLWLTAGTSLAAALVTLVIPHDAGRIAADDRPAVAPASAWAQFRVGWRVLLGNPFLVTTTALSLAMVFILGGFQSLILPAYFTGLNQPGQLGFVLTWIAVGLLAGSGWYAVLGTRHGRRGFLALGVAGTGLGFGVMAVLSSPWMVMAGAFLLGVAGGILNSVLAVITVEQVPEEALGRVSGTQNAALTAVAPAGTILAAILVELCGLAITAAVFAFVWLVVAIGCLRGSSLRRLEASPAAVEEAGVA